jgi:inward rectifier potassium channel
MRIKRNLHRPVIKLEQRDGVLQVVGGNSWHSYFRDPYHLLLTIPWVGFLGIVMGFDIFLNAVFAVLYLLDANAIAGIPKVGFMEAFFLHQFAIEVVYFITMYLVQTERNGELICEGIWVNF